MILRKNKPLRSLIFTKYQRPFVFLIFVVVYSHPVVFLASANAATFRTVALEGQQAPGTSAGSVFNLFDRPGYVDTPSLNNAGQVSFVATLLGNEVNSSNAEGIWSEGSGSLSLIAREGSPAPNTASNFLTVAAPTINEGGQVAFLGDLPGGVNAPTHFDGLWAGTEGNVSLVAGDGGAVPGASVGSVFEAIDQNTLYNGTGKVGFTSLVYRPADAIPGSLGENYYGAFSTSTGSLALVAGKGMSAPGLSSGVSFSGAGVTGLNDNGQVVISASLEGVGVVDANDQGIWSEGSGSLQLVAREGDAAPGTSAGVNFSKFRQAVINDAGKVAFRSELVGTGVVSSNENGIWSDRSGALSQVVRGGMPALGTDPGLSFFDFEPPVMNNANQLAFRATLGGVGLDLDNNDALWREDGSGGLDLIIREGDSVPGMAANFVFGQPSKPVINALGQVLFSVSTYDPSVSFGPFSGSVWIAHPGGDLEMIFSIGDQQIDNVIEVLPGDFRTISQANFFAGTNQLSGTGQGDGRPSAFNDAGQIAMHLEFTDGTEGIFVVSTAMAIPEPSTFFLALSFAAIYLGLNNRRGRHAC